MLWRALKSKAKNVFWEFGKQPRFYSFQNESQFIKANIFNESFIVLRDIKKLLQLFLEKYFSFQTILFASNFCEVKLDEIGKRLHWKDSLMLMTTKLVNASATLNFDGANTCFSITKIKKAWWKTLRKPSNRKSVQCCLRDAFHRFSVLCHLVQF